VGFENFPEIESFSKLPKKLILKAGETAFNAEGDATLSGIVINNLGQSVQNVEVFLVLFDDKNIPQEHLKTASDPAELAQGGLGSFRFVAKGRKEKIVNYYLHTQWDYIDKDWE
jgi:hypothetical protein